jgi:hypothetical protein
MAEVKPLKAGATGIETFGATDTLPATALPAPSVISPAQITSDQDDYNPTGFSTANFVRLSGDSSIRAITGLNAGYDGEQKIFANVGDYPIYFPGEHPDSTAANRIYAGEDLFLFPKTLMRGIYDGTLDRWVLMPDNPNTNTAKRLQYLFSPGSVSTGDWGDVSFSVISTGTTSASAASVAAVSLPAVSLSTATSSTSGAYAFFAKSINTIGGFSKQHIVCSSLISLEDLSTSGERFLCGIQISAGITSSSFAPNNTVGIRYSDNVNSGNWECFTVNTSGTESVADSGIAVAADTLYELAIFVDKSLTEARFYINRAYVGRITSNLPSNTAFWGVRDVILKSVGSTARILYVHSLRTESISS